jgi:hypothetical protein
VASRVRQWLVNPGSIYKAISAWLPDPSTQQLLVARAAQIGRQWSEQPQARRRAVLTALIDRVDIHLSPPRLTALFDVAAPSQSIHDEETLILSLSTLPCGLSPSRRRNSGVSSAA